MNRIQTSLVIAALSAAIVLWQLGQFWQPQTSPAVVTSELSPSAMPEPTPPSPSATISMPTGSAAGIQNQPDAAHPIATEEVLGLEVRKDRRCTLSLRQYPDPETSALKNAYRCVPDGPLQPHPYESWGEAELANLAYGDADAARVLGLRHIRSEDPRQEAFGLSLLYRSVALSGDLAAFQRAIGQRYAYLRVDGKPQIDNAKQLLVFNIIGETLGDRRFNGAHIIDELKRAELPQKDIEAIQSAARNILEAMADLQTEMTGDTTIREAITHA